MIISLRQILGVLLTGSVVLIPSSPVLAQFNPVHIGTVTVIPEGAITPADAVSLDVGLTSGSCCIELLQPTEVQIVGEEILVDIFAGSGLLGIPDVHRETVPLGTFDRGTYFYEVTQNGPTIFPSQVLGLFQVVPEPSTVAMIAVAIPLLLFQFCSSDGRGELADV